MSDFWQTATDWWRHAALAGGVVLLLGWLGVRLTSNPARRQRLAGWAMRGAVLAAVLCALPSWWTVRVPTWNATERERIAATHSGASEPEPGVAVEPFPVEAMPEFAVTEVLPTSPEPPVAPAPLRVAATPPPALDLAPLLLSAYAFIVFALLAQLAAGHVALRQLRRAANPAPLRVRDLFAELTANWSRSPTLRVSDCVECAVCFGILRPTILIPRALASTASIDELRWVLAHELDHLQRGDPRLAVWTGLARALFFFVPWYWMLRRDLILAQEHLADAAAAAADGRTVDYAAFLVTLSGGSSPQRRRIRTPQLAHAVLAGRSDLFRRVTMLLNSSEGVSRRCSRSWAIAAAGGFLSAAIVLSGINWATADERAKPQDKKEPDKPKAERPRGDNPDKPRPDGERPAARPDGERPPARREGDKPRLFDADEVRKLQKQIEDAAKENDPDEVRRLVDKLMKAMLAGGPPMPPQFRPFDGPPPERVREAIEAARRQLSELQEKLKGELNKDQEAKVREEIARVEKEVRERISGFGGFGIPGGRFGGGPSVRLGVMVGPIPEVLADQIDLPKHQGLLIGEVVKDSAAEKAGLKKHDVLLQFNGKDVPSDPRALPEMVDNIKTGEKVAVVVMRKGKRETISVELPEAPKPPEGRRPDGDRPDGRRGEAGRGPKIKFTSMAVMVTNDNFEIKAGTAERKYEVVGAFDDGKPNLSKITITEGKDAKEYKDLREVPEEHHAAIRQLLGSVSGR